MGRSLTPNDPRGGATAKYVAVLKGDLCVYCGEPAGTIEHIVPRSFFKVRGPRDVGQSRDHWTNLSASCYKCNKERDRKPFLLYLLEKMKHAEEM